MKRKHVLPIHIDFSACFTQILMNCPYVFSGTMLTEIFLVGFSVFRRWHLFLPLQSKKDVDCTLSKEQSQKSDEWGNSWMLEFVQLIKVKNIIHIKAVGESYCPKLTFLYCISIKILPLKTNSFCEAIKTNTENYLSLTIQDPTTDQQTFPTRKC